VGTARADRLGVRTTLPTTPSRRRDALLALGIVAALTYWLVPYSLGTEIALYDSVVLLATVASVVGWRRAAADQRLAWLCTSATLVLFLGGELTWSTYSALGREPFPSIADASFLVAYIPLAIAAAALGSARHSEPDRSVWLDAGILTAVVGLVVFAVLMEPYVHDPTSSTVSKLFTIAYPLADILVLGFVLRLVFSRQARTRATTLFTIGVGLMLTADMAFGWQSLRGIDTSGSWLELAWLVSYLVVGFAPLYSSSGRMLEIHGAEGTGRGRLALVLAAVAVPQVVLMRELATRGLVGFDTLVVATCVSTLVMGLVSVRLWRLLGRARRVEEHRGAQRLSALIDHSADAIFLVDRDCQISFASPAAATLRSQPAEACLATSLLDAFVEESRPVIAGQLRNLAARPTGATVALAGDVRAADGTILAVEGTGCNLLADENVRAVVVTLRDVTRRRQLEAQLERRAFHDELTGLANRALFSDRVTHALDRSSRDISCVAILFIDLDDFKTVNDGMGHAAGDELIRGVAERIRSGLRPADTVARFGGDEFAVLLEDVTSYEHAAASGRRLLELLQLPIEVSGISLAVPASVGITLATPGCTVASLLRDADIAMYNAKAQGKGQVAMFHESLLDVASQRLTLKIELPEALKAGQFRLDYQPIVDVKSEALRGFEALIRWHHPERGLVSPGDFIPAAEDTGVIVDIGRWVLKEACGQAVAWNARSARPLTMNVNISTAQLYDPAFFDDLQRVLAATRFSPSLLVLELTESVLARHDRVQPILEQLRAIGVGIAIDDFGTGYSSLSYLQDFPVTSIKVDQSFVADLVSGGNNGLLKSIFSMAEALDLACVAEGVETQDQLEALSELDCELAQGFHLGRPMAVDRIDSLIESQSQNSLLP
jgi:diguanylate cyclase (GGDEF)-like protein/PAS domain S-box-containing protein